MRLRRETIRQPVPPACPATSFARLQRRRISPASLSKESSPDERNRQAPEGVGRGSSETRGAGRQLCSMRARRDASVRLRTDSFGADGKLAERQMGKLKADSEIHAAREAARLCVVNVLAQAHAALGDLDRIAQVVRLGGFFNVGTTFDALPQAMNGASDLVAELFGAQVAMRERRSACRICRSMLWPRSKPFSRSRLEAGQRSRLAHAASNRPSRLTR